jgi:plasmid maintenance system antidote protein VapI
MKGIKETAVINSKDSITPEMAIRVSKAFGRPEHWLWNQLAHDAPGIRKKVDTIQIERYPSLYRVILRGVHQRE